MTAPMRRAIFPLNPDQQSAAESNSRVIMVNGSAGTGMTQAVVGRVAHLLSRGHDPANITCLTSRKNVPDLTGRLAEHDLIAKHIEGLFVGDLCGFASSFLRSEAAKALGIIRDYTLWTHSRGIDETVRSWKEADRPSVDRSKVRRALDQHWRDRACGMIGTTHHPWKSDWSEIIKFYQDLKWSQRALDSSDVLLLATKALSPTGSLRGEPMSDFPLISQRTQHLVVDQGEELTLEESDLLFRLSRGSESLMVAYDPNQATIMDQHSDFQEAMRLRAPGMRRFTLRVNHASTNRLSEFLVGLTGESNSLRTVEQHAMWSSEKKPFLRRVRGSLIEMYIQCIDEVQRLVESGVELNEIALLYRRGRPIGRLRSLLTHRDIPYRVLDEPEVLRGSDGRAVVALLTCLLNPKDLSALRVAAAPGFPNKAREMRSTLVKKVRSLTHKENSNIWHELFRYRDVLPDGDPDRRSLTYFVDAVQRLEPVIADPMATLGQIIDEAEEIVEAAKAPGQRGYSDRDMVRLRDLLDATPRDAGEWVVSHMGRLVDRWTLGMAERRTCLHGVAIGTFASSKGQHWKAVLLLDVQDGTIPGRDADKNPSLLAREARLFYLASSRATNILCFYMPQRAGGVGYRLSRFLSPLGDQLVQG